MGIELSKSEAMNGGAPEIAVIGMACRFPQAGDYISFWDNLIAGRNSIREITPDRWDLGRFYSTSFHEANTSVSKWCGLLDDIDRFDHAFFNISPREARNMDPQQRLILETAWHCLEDAAITPARLRERLTAVYIGVMSADYQQEVSAPGVAIDSYAALGNYDCILANRLSYFLGTEGPSFTINAACASSLIALHKARQLLRRGESDYALVGGVSLNSHPWKYISFSKSRMLSPDGQCKTFDKDANGTGARWMLESMEALQGKGSDDECLRSLTGSMIQQQATGAPVHNWELANFSQQQDWLESYRTVSQFMATDLFTVQPDDIIDFAASLMEWRHIRHIPVEDDTGQLLGLISHRSILHLIAKGESSESVSVSDIMYQNPLTIDPDTTTLKAIQIMRENKLSCLPVTKDGKLLGMVTEHDLAVVAGRLLERYLGE